MASIQQYFDAFMPHRMCYSWRADIFWLHVLSDFAVGIIYFSIPIALFHFLRNRSDAPFKNVAIMFGVFMFSCGLTHMMGIWIVWNGHYGIQGLLKTITAFTSVAAAVMLYPVMPKLLALRSPVELIQSNMALQKEIQNRKSEEAKTRQLQSELVHIGRLSTMGEMATGLAHELNQPLLAISQSSDTALLIAKESKNPNPMFEECLQDIQQETQRAGDIIRALRQLVSKDSAKRSNIDLCKLCDQTIQLMMPEAKSHNISLNNLTQGVLTQPSLDRVQIAQVLVNLLRNGIQAIAENESIERVVNVCVSQLENTMTVSVEDTGPGISSEIQLFKPFETSRSDGMGMGLSISRSIVEGHGGKIVVESGRHRGAKILFTLPILSGA